MTDDKPEGKQYFEDRLKRIIDKMRVIQAFDIRDTGRFDQEGIHTLVDMRRDILELGLDLVEKVNSHEANLRENKERTVLLGLWAQYQRVHKMQETINWYYSDAIEIERRLFLQGLHPSQEKSEVKRKLQVQYGINEDA